MVTVTHHVEMLDRMNLFKKEHDGTQDVFVSNVIRVDLATTKFRKALQSAVTLKRFSCDKTTCDLLRKPELLALWFCRGAIVVEGITDRAFLKAISELLPNPEFSNLFNVSVSPQATFPIV